jgi:electron transfer flavoprotein beta subunit
VQFVINPNDEFGLTRAIWFKEKQGAQVHVIHVGTAAAEPTLRKCLAIGADKAFRVDTPATDGIQVAKELAAFVSTNPYDLVIAGRESIDYNGAMVPGILAALLDIAFVPNCVGLEIDGNNAVAEREIDGGREKLKGNLRWLLADKRVLLKKLILKFQTCAASCKHDKNPLKCLIQRARRSPPKMCYLKSQLQKQKSSSFLLTTSIN